MIVREFLTKLGFDADDGKVRSFDGAVKGLVGNITLAIGAMKALNAAAFGLAMNAAKVGDEIAKTSRQIGVSGQALQEYRFAFDRLGVSEGEATAGLERFNRAIGRAAEGNATEADAFEKLGISIRDADGRLRDMESLLPEAADALSRIESEAERAAVAQDLFGRSGGRLAMALAAGGEEIEGLREEFRRLGGALSDDQLKAAEEFTDAMTNLRTVLNGIKLQIGAELMPVFRPMIESFTQFALMHRDGFIEGIADAFGFLSNAFQNLRGFLFDVFGGFSSLMDVMAGGEAGLREWGILIGALLAIFARKWFIVAALLVILDDFLAWQQGQDSVIGNLIGSYDSWKERIDAVIDRLGGLENVINMILGLALAKWAWGVSAGFFAAAAGVGALNAALTTLSRHPLMRLVTVMATGASLEPGTTDTSALGALRGGLSEPGRLDRMLGAEPGETLGASLYRKLFGGSDPAPDADSQHLGRMVLTPRETGRAPEAAPMPPVVSDGATGGMVPMPPLQETLDGIQRLLEQNGIGDGASVDIDQGSLSGPVDNSRIVNMSVSQSITVPPGTTSEQIAFIRAETERVVAREADRAAKALEA